MNSSEQLWINIDLWYALSLQIEHSLRRDHITPDMFLNDAHHFQAIRKHHVDEVSINQVAILLLKMQWWVGWIRNGVRSCTQTGKEHDLRLDRQWVEKREEISVYEGVWGCMRERVGVCDYEHEWEWKSECVSMSMSMNESETEQVSQSVWAWECECVSPYAWKCESERVWRRRSFEYERNCDSTYSDSLTLARLLTKSWNCLREVVRVTRFATRKRAPPPASGVTTA